MKNIKEIFKNNKDNSDYSINMEQSVKRLDKRGKDSI
jgi:hypothetical protein